MSDGKETWPDHGPTYRDWIDYVIRNSSHASKVLTPAGWSEWDAGRYARQQYEEFQRDRAATNEMLKKALLRCDELASLLRRVRDKLGVYQVALGPKLLVDEINLTLGDATNERMEARNYP